MAMLTSDPVPRTEPDSSWARTCISMLDEGATMALISPCVAADGPWASSDYTGAGYLSFLSRPPRAGPPPTICECAAFHHLLADLMGTVTLHATRMMASQCAPLPLLCAAITAHVESTMVLVTPPDDRMMTPLRLHGPVALPDSPHIYSLRTILNMFNNRLVVARGLCDTAFGSAAAHLDATFTSFWMRYSTFLAGHGRRSCSAA
jgi:hypothetical protein